MGGTGGKTLFGEDLGGNERKAKRPSSGAPRVKRPDRRQSVLRPEVIDDLLPPDHRARAIVAAIEKLDLSAFYEPIKSRGTDPGRPATDPQMLVALWLFAISEGVGSGRQLERLCERDDAYRWICGGVQVNYHTLTDFRVDHGRALDDLLTQLLGALMHEGLVKLQRVAQDGMRVRASAGAASFHRIRSLRKCIAAAKEQVKRAKAMLDKDDPTRSDKARVARERAARQREDRVTKALAELKKLQASAKSKEDAEGTRVSTTDPDARVMRMPGGGHRPAYNVQLATDTESNVIVGVGVTNVGSDRSQLSPMLDDVVRRTGKLPDDWLADGGFVNFGSIQEAGEQGVDVFAPPQSAKVTDPLEPRPTDPEHVAAWRRRMGSRKGKEVYKQRAATAERVNADLRAHRGFDQLPVRGIDKALMVSLWMALTYNILTWISASPPVA